MRSRIFVINTCDKVIKIENLIFPPGEEKTFMIELTSMQFLKIRAERRLKVGNTSGRLKKYFEVAEKRNKRIDSSQETIKKEVREKEVREKEVREKEVREKEVPLVSIITPCYNGQSYLHRYFQAMLRQTYRNFELIFVNDYSTDKTGIIAENYKPKLQAKNIEVKIINLIKNVGVAGAVNEGLKHFTGDYVMFLDSDDVMYPDHIEEKVRFLEHNKQYAWAACRIRKVKNSRPVGMLQVSHEKKAENIFERLILHQKVCYSPVLYFYRTSKFLEVNPSRSIYATRHGQNWQLLLPTAYKYECAFIDKVLGDYVVRPNSLSRTINWPKLLDKTNEREFILTDTLNRINMPDKQKQEYINMIKQAYVKKKVMLLGGTGVLSRDVAKQCIESGMDVYMINRGNRKVPKEATVIIGDINKLSSRRLCNMKFDVVIDFLAYTSRQLNRHLELFKGRCRQYIFISSATAYAISERPITEKTPLTNVGWSYSANKIRCETALKKYYKKAAKYYTIIRPYITYGDTRIPYPFIPKKSNWTLVQRIIDRKPIPVWGKNICTLTHTEDFARALAGLIGNKKAVNQDFHVTSDEHITWGQALELIGKAIGAKPKTVYIPPKRIEKVFASLKGELTCDKAHTRIFDNTKIKVAVKGWKCNICFKDGIKKTIDYYQNNPEMKSINKTWIDKSETLIREELN